MVNYAHNMDQEICPGVEEESLSHANRVGSHQTNWRKTSPQFDWMKVALIVWIRWRLGMLMFRNRQQFYQAYYAALR